MSIREQATVEVEKLAQAFWNTGEADSWFDGADELIRKVAATVNGPALHKLATDTVFCDTDAVEMFRSGGDFIGRLPRSGLGIEQEFSPHFPIRQLEYSCAYHNSELISSLKEDKNSKELLSLTVADVQLGRMTDPVQVRRQRSTIVHQQFPRQHVYLQHGNGFSQSLGLCERGVH